MAAEKRLIVVVEGTAAMAPFWHTVIHDYLFKILRYFCGIDLRGRKPSVSNFELALIVYNVHGSYSACLVQRSGWTRDVNVFKQWLSDIPFSGGGFSDAVIAEGLAEALMMLSVASNGTRAPPNGAVHKHCILAAASNPYSLPLLVHQPMKSTEQIEINECQRESCLADAEAVAKLFAQNCISLSVICPKQLPKLKAIYNAGKCNQHAADPPIDNSKYLVLVSEDFIEAHAAFGKSRNSDSRTNQSSLKIDRDEHQPAPVNISVKKRQTDSIENIRTSTAKVGPTALSHVASAQIPSLPSPTSQGVQTLATFSPSVSSEENVSIVDKGKMLKPMLDKPPGFHFFTMATSRMAENPNPGSSQPSGNHDGDACMGQSVLNLNQQWSLSANQVVQSGIGMNLNTTSWVRPSITSSEIGAMEPIVGMNKQVITEIQPGCLNINISANLPFSLQNWGDSQSPQSRFVKFWEGNMYAVKEGEPVYLTNLQGYRSSSASVTLGANWPPEIKVVQLVSLSIMTDKKYDGVAEFLVFSANKPHGFLGQMHKKKLCGVVQLASQTLLLSVCENTRSLTGMLIPKVGVASN